MGEHIIKLPDVGEGVAEAELVEWHVKVGDIVREDQVLAAVMTDKATVEIPSPVAGSRRGGRRRDRRHPGGRVAAGADRAPATGHRRGSTRRSPLLNPSPPPPRRSAAARTIGQTTRWHPPSRHLQLRPRRHRSPRPRVRQRAARLGIDLAGVTALAPPGASATTTSTPIRSARPPPGASGLADDVIEEIKVVGLRRNIAEKMQLAK